MTRVALNFSTLLHLVLCSGISLGMVLENWSLLTFCFYNSVSHNYQELYSKCVKKTVPGRCINFVSTFLLGVMIVLGVFPTKLTSFLVMLTRRSHFA